MRTNSRKILAIAGLLSLLVAPLQAGKKAPKASIGFHIQGEASDTSKFVFPIQIGNPPREIYFKQIPEISNKDIVGFIPIAGDVPGSYGACLQLGPHGTLTLEALSRSQRGQYLLASYNGAPVDYVKIDGVVNDGIVTIWRGLGTEQIEAMRKEFKVYGEQQAPKKKKRWFSRKEES